MTSQHQKRRNHQTVSCSGTYADSPDRLIANHEAGSTYPDTLTVVFLLNVVSFSLLATRVLSSFFLISLASGLKRYPQRIGRFASRSSLFSPTEFSRASEERAKGKGEKGEETPNSNPRAEGPSHALIPRPIDGPRVSPRSDELRLP